MNDATMDLNLSLLCWTAVGDQKFGSVLTVEFWFVLNKLQQQSAVCLRASVLG
jgi:hypothetical protein